MCQEEKYCIVNEYDMHSQRGGQHAWSTTTMMCVFAHETNSLSVGTFMLTVCSPCT